MNELHVNPRSFRVKRNIRKRVLELSATLELLQIILDQHSRIRSIRETTGLEAMNVLGVFIPPSATIVQDPSFPQTSATAKKTLASQK